MEVTTTERQKIEAADAKWIEPPQSFIELWNAACVIDGKYNSKTGYFEINELYDVTYEQAKAIYEAPRISTPWMKGVNGGTTRTLIISNEGGMFAGYSLSNSFRNSTYETLRLGNMKVSDLGATFTNCWYLRKIIGTLDVSQCAEGYYLGGLSATLPKLQEVKIKGLRYSMSIESSPLLSLSTLQYLVDNAANTKEIKITVHPDVYAKLTGDTTNAAAAALSEEERSQWMALCERAAEKQIVFTIPT